MAYALSGGQTMLSCLLAITVSIAAQQQQPAPIAVVEGTLTEAKSASEGPAARRFFRAAADCLAEHGLPVARLTDEAVARGELKGRAVAVFPYSAFWSADEARAVTDFIAAGGKVVVFYTAPDSVYRALGAAKVKLRREAYPGELAELRRVQDAPPIFPERVGQRSGNLAEILQVAEGARPLYHWFDQAGEHTGVIGALISQHGILFTHVLTGADWPGQRRMLLAAVLHFWPEGARAVTDAALRRILAHTQFSSPESLAKKAPTHARKLADELLAAVSRARQAAETADVGTCLDAAAEAQRLADQIVCAMEKPRDFELRGCWVSVHDGTDWDSICRRLAEANFNAIFPNMCSAGRAWYPTKLLPVVGKRDELAACIRAAHRYGLEVHVWRVNWCTLGAPKQWLEKLATEGRLMKRWDGKSMFEDRSADATPWLCPTDERNRRLERDVMLEIVRRYHPDGIHFDYMRFPSNNYCYCDRCRRKFEEAIGSKVENWPADCRPGGKLWDRWVKWRASLITSLAREIADEARKIDPSVKVSLAARALPGAPINDGQDWPLWCREHILDFVVPMNYTGRDRERLKRVITDQLQAIGESVPLYSGLGVTYRPTSLGDPVAISSQIVLARELGAQGFVIFVWNDVLRDALAALKLGVCREPVTLLPHRSAPAEITFDWREADFKPRLPERAFPFIQPPKVTVRVRLPGGARGRATVQVAPSAGGEPVARKAVRVAGRAVTRVALPARPGIWEVQVVGEIEGQREKFFRRTLPFRLLTNAQLEAVAARLRPPKFKAHGIRVGVAVGGYGTDGILSALLQSRRFLVAPLYQLARDFLAPCHVVVVPQLRSDVDSVFNAHLDELREFVRAGGGLLLTHDAVGFRSHKPLFPEKLKPLPRPIRSRRVRVAMSHTLTSRLPREFEHSYYDHIAFEPNPEVLTVLEDDQGHPVAVAFQFGRGRVVACGMAIGLADDDSEVPPQDGELQFLINAIHWLATKR